MSNDKQSNDDLLRDSIIDANKLVETATAYAKEIIGEAITPQIKKQLTQKLQQEVEGEEDDYSEEDSFEDLMPDTVDGEEEPSVELPVKPEIPAGSEGDLPLEVPVEPEGDLPPEVPAEPEGDVDNELEIPTEPEEDDDIEEEVNAILKELEEDDSAIDEEEELPDEEDVIPFDDGEDELEEITEEEINDILSQLREDDELDLDLEDDEYEVELEDKEEFTEVKRQRDKAIKTVEELRATINEMNLLNSKLLFTNRLLRQFTLSENQKLRIIETLDKSRTLREVKLVYATLADTLNHTNKRRKIKENYASSIISDPTNKKDKSVIAEGKDLKARFQFLADMKPKKQKKLIN